MTRMTIFDTLQQWGALFSHYSEDLGPIQEFDSKADAVAHGKKIAAAQPGIEFEVMTRAPAIRGCLRLTGKPCVRSLTAAGRGPSPGSLSPGAVHMLPMKLEQTPNGPQLTIGQLIAALNELPGGILIHMAGVGNNNVPFELNRHRRHSDGVLIRARYERASFMTVERLKVMLSMHASQEVTKFNPHPATMETPLWVTADHQLEFRAVTGVDVIKDAAYLRWVDVAPFQGPALQRISDVEVLRRNAELSGRTDANLDPAFGGNRWMLAEIPKERDRTRARLLETQGMLAKLTREVAELEAASVRYDYTLGLTDVHPGQPEWVRS